MTDSDLVRAMTIIFNPAYFLFTLFFTVATVSVFIRSKGSQYELFGVLILFDIIWIWFLQSKYQEMKDYD